MVVFPTELRELNLEAKRRKNVIRSLQINKLHKYKQIMKNND